ncbi:MAG TPA: EAL domain-containing protein, partial [Telluria sp.]|nr:EAL domain-containing protein [Telluria sp.]
MKDLRQQVEAIAREIGLDGHEIEARKRFLELTDDDCRVLAEVHALIAQDGAGLADGFYEHVLSFPQLRELVPDDATEQRLHHSQSAYFSRLTCGQYDEAYVLDRLRVGAVHERIGLQPKWYIGAYRKYLSELLKLLGRELPGQPERFSAAVDAILKVVCFDMGLALDTYFHASQRSVLQNRDYLEQVIGGMPAGLIVLDDQLRVRAMNRMMADMLGVPDDTPSAQPPLSDILACPELARRVGEALAGGLAQDNVIATVDGRADGVRYFEFNIRRTRQADGHQLLLIGQDVTFRRRARQRLQESEEYFRLTFSQAAVGIAHVARDGRFMRVNGKLAQIVGYSEAELVQKCCAQITHPEDIAEDSALNARLAAGEIGEYTREKRFLRRDGTPVWVNKSMSAMRDAAGHLRFIAVVEDISRRKQAEEALVRMANHDALTGLPNRVLLQDRLAQAIVQAQRNGHEVSVMFIDLDRFKHVNDSLGHDAGDALIVEIARRLSGCLRESDTVARQGGDEFVVVLADLAGPGDAVNVAHKVLGSLFQPLELCGQEVFPTGSIGIAMYPRDGHDSQTLLKCADTAMYHAKASGGNSFAFFSADMGMQSFEHLQMEGALQRALLHGEFVLHYQPVLDAGNSGLAGVEALLRWQSRRQGLVMPAEFIPLAEETGLIMQIGEWVLASALAQLVAWRAQGLEPPRVYVNLSARQFHDHDLAAQVERLARAAGADPSWLGLEITESVLMENPAAAAQTMHRLAALGVHLAIDDFGTGYSSLASLRRFPINSLKIDRSFIGDIGADAADAEIVKAVIALAHSMKLKVVAEGVEQEGQLAFLRAHGCDQVQGYYFSRPRPAQEIEA